VNSFSSYSGCTHHNTNSNKVNRVINVINIKPSNNNLMLCFSIGFMLS
jgi:hypothetical protein